MKKTATDVAVWHIQEQEQEGKHPGSWREEKASFRRVTEVLRKSRGDMPASRRKKR
jgi:hypothetical protein